MFMEPLSILYTRTLTVRHQEWIYIHTYFTTESSNNRYRDFLSQAYQLD